MFKSNTVPLQTNNNFHPYTPPDPFGGFYPYTTKEYVKSGKAAKMELGKTSKEEQSKLQYIKGLIEGARLTKSTDKIDALLDKILKVIDG